MDTGGERHWAQTEGPRCAEPWSEAKCGWLRPWESAVERPALGDGDGTERGQVTSQWVLCVSCEDLISNPHLHAGELFYRYFSLTDQIMEAP